MRKSKAIMIKPSVVERLRVLALSEGYERKFLNRYIESLGRRFKFALAFGTFELGKTSEQPIKHQMRIHDEQYKNLLAVAGANCCEVGEILEFLSLELKPADTPYSDMHCSECGQKLPSKIKYK